MNPRLYEIQQQRAALLVKIAAQREEMSQITHQWKKPLDLVDQGITAIRWLRSHPLAWVGMASIFLLRRKSVLSLLMSAWRGWKFYRRTKDLLNKARQA